MFRKCFVKHFEYGKLKFQLSIYGSTFSNYIDVFFIVKTTLLDINCFILVQPINLLISLFITAILFHGRLGVFYQLFSTQFAHKNVNVPCEGYVNFLYLSLQKHNVKALTWGLFNIASARVAGIGNFGERSLCWRHLSWPVNGISCWKCLSFHTL